MKITGKIRFVDCHRLPERSFYYKNKKLPLCSRCMGIYFGFISFPFFVLGMDNPNILISITYLLPTLIDGVFQAFHGKESTNKLRFSTGIFAGLGISSIIHVMGEETGKLILNLCL